jgi:ppGpp synthetase/RelA/SpoT-type nucleotidyltranferase
LIQKIPEVHSVRWRVKSTDHLLEKIVRKRLAGSSKYIDLNPQNYNQTISDLIGLRALHLFKEDYIPIDACLRRRWEPLETPIIFVREGDDRQRIDENLFEVKQHPAGYRSVHYALPNHTLNQQGSLEVQVRTIFEEGWSEIDHKVRYPNFSDKANSITKCNTV